MLIPSPDDAKSAMQRRVGLVAVVAALVASVALAGRAYAQVLPIQAMGAQTVRGDGIDLRFDANWVEGPGYVPVTITAGQFGPSRSDRQIVIELQHSTAYDRRTVVRQEIVVPPSPQTTTVCVPMPRWVSDYMGQHELTVYENGRRLRKLSGSYISIPPRVNTSSFNERFPSMLFISETAVDSSTLSTMFPDSWSGVSGAGVPLSTSQTVAPSRLPVEWIDYTCLDLIVISRKQLESLSQQQPQAWDAVQRWVLAGGNIVVHGFPADWDGLAVIDELVAPPPSSVLGVGSGLRAPNPGRPNANDTRGERSDGNDTEANNAENNDAADGNAAGGEPQGDDSEADASHGGWVTLNDVEDVRPLRDEELVDGYDLRTWQSNTSQRTPIVQYSVRVVPSDDGEAEPGDAEFKAREDDARRNVRWRLAGLGRIVAVADTELFPGGRPIWRAIIGSLERSVRGGRIVEDRWHWHQRMGVSLLQDNPSFWEFLVPGVGHALVTEFQVLITLFVLVIGPLNYFFLRRRNKLHLIIFTTPLSAAVVTVALMAWGLVADGISTRVRARSFTHIDQRDGTAVCWSRQSYYAGIAPAGGLVFPRDVAVIPIRVADAESSSIEWLTVWDDAQRLESGWLPSRTPTQLLAIRSRPTAAGLTIVPARTDAPSETDAAPASIMVTNRLGTRIQRLIITDLDGNDYAIDEPLEPGQVRTLTQLDDDNFVLAAQAFRGLLTQHRPRRPEGFTKDSSGVFGSSSRRWYSYGAEYDTVSADRSLLERQFAIAERTLAGPPVNLAAGSYMAIVERSPEVVFGTDQAEEEASTHFVTGAW
ncbi:MAG: hypothetical protein KDA63_06595 [Planctomycetales bacterium]|nr:hypothetical protein [Planctomycetales bacterium]